MAKVNCSACDSLREDAPNFVVNGLGTTECNSLKNDTGLNPSSGNNDCTDLENMNDCLIGNMESEIELYDVCDWKDYMRKFVQNAWTMFKGINCAICGLWANVTSLRKKNTELCALIDALINPPLSRYGTLTNDLGEQYPDHKGGTIGIKSNKKIVVPMEQSELSDPVWKAQNMGIYHGKQKMAKCSDGTCQSYEWIAPNTVGYRVNPDLELEIGDILWYATKAECVAWGISDDMWNAFSISSWTWQGYGLGSSSKRALVWLRLAVTNNRLELTYQGYVGDEQTTANRQITEETEPAKRYIYSC